MEELGRKVALRAWSGEKAAKGLDLRLGREFAILMSVLVQVKRTLNTNTVLKAVRKRTDISQVANPTWNVDTTSLTTQQLVDHLLCDETGLHDLCLVLVAQLLFDYVSGSPVWVHDGAEDPLGLVEELELELERLVEREDAGFGCAVIGATGGHDEGGSACDSHNVAVVGPDHVREEDLEGIKLGQQVDLDGKLGLFGLELDDATPIIGNTRVVDQDRHGTQILLDLLARRQDTVVVRHVSLVEANRIRKHISPWFDQIEDGHFDALCSQTLYDLDTDTTGATGDDGDFAGGIGPGFACGDALATLEELAHDVQGEDGQRGSTGFGGGELGVVPAETLLDRADCETHGCRVR